MAMGPEMSYPSCRPFARWRSLLVKAVHTLYLNYEMGNMSLCTSSWRRLVSGPTSQDSDLDRLHPGGRLCLLWL
jgi:hypothetical protein